MLLYPANQFQVLKLDTNSNLIHKLSLKIIAIVFYHLKQTNKYAMKCDAIIICISFNILEES